MFHARVRSPPSGCGRRTFVGGRRCVSRLEARNYVPGAVGWLHTPCESPLRITNTSALSKEHLPISLFSPGWIESADVLAPCLFRAGPARSRKQPRWLHYRVVCGIRHSTASSYKPCSRLVRSIALAKRLSSALSQISEADGAPDGLLRSRRDLGRRRCGLRASGY